MIFIKLIQDRRQELVASFKRVAKDSEIKKMADEDLSDCLNQLLAY